jgi:predicted DNA-binding transcriptional regulator YafY
VVSPAVIGEIALATRDRERLRLRYVDGEGQESVRRVEPHALAPAGRKWFLLCWDLDREDWRTFRVDRVVSVEHTRVLFTRRRITEDEIEERVLIASSWSPQKVEAAAVMELPLAEMQERFGPWSQGATAVGEDRTRWPVGGSDWREAMYGLLWIPEGVGYALALPEPHRAELREAVSRLLRALDAPTPDDLG